MILRYRAFIIQILTEVAGWQIEWKVLLLKFESVKCLIAYLFPCLTQYKLYFFSWLNVSASQKILNFSYDSFPSDTSQNSSWSLSSHFFAFLTQFSAYLLLALTSAFNLSKIFCFMLNSPFLLYTYSRTIKDKWSQLKAIIIQLIKLKRLRTSLLLTFHLAT